MAAPIKDTLYKGMQRVNSIATGQEFANIINRVVEKRQEYYNKQEADHANAGTAFNALPKTEPVKSSKKINHNIQPL